MVSPSDHEIILDWLPKEGDQDWNNPLAQILEVFGLPGDRFMCVPTNDFMVVTFKSKKDATLCRIMLSEKLA